MTNSNRKTGNAFEKRLCVVLSESGWWAHNLAQNAAGQPFDVLAAKNGVSVPIDCKVCANDIFQLSRIEENQYSAMSLWADTGNEYGWFALELKNGEIRMISFPQLMHLSAHTSVLGRSEIIRHSYSLDEWMERGVT